MGAQIPGKKRSRSKIEIGKIKIKMEKSAAQISRSDSRNLEMTWAMQRAKDQGTREGRWQSKSDGGKKKRRKWPSTCKKRKFNKKIRQGGGNLVKTKKRRREEFKLRSNCREELKLAPGESGS